MADFKVKFRAEDDRLFRVAFEGFLATARPATRQEHKMTDSILTKMESISTEDPAKGIVPGYNPDEPTSPTRRILQTVGGYFILDEAHFNYFRKSIDGIQCAAPMSRTIVQLNNLLDTAKTGDAKELVKEEEAQEQSPPDLPASAETVASVN